jgi:excisionase family DNA binding protein
VLDGEADTIAAPDRDLTVEELAEKVGRAVSTVRTWLIAGDLRGYKLNGKSWRIPQSALRAYVDAQTTVSVPDDAGDEQDDENVDISA